MALRVTVAFLEIGCISAKWHGARRDADVAFDHAEQRAVDNCGDDLLLRHGPFLAGWRVTFALPMTLPHFDHFDVPS